LITLRVVFIVISFLKGSSRFMRHSGCLGNLFQWFPPEGWGFG
jgi:hypothetical protein